MHLNRKRIALLCAAVLLLLLTACGSKTEPTVTPPAEPAPVPTEPEPVEPTVPVEPESVEPTVPAEPEPVEPTVPVEPEPVEPTVPVEPEPVEPPVPTEPEPVEPPVPTEPEPVEPPVPAEPEPVEPPAPTEPEPVEPPVPAEPEPVEPPVPAEPEPVEPPVPVEPEPVEPPVPTEPEPVEPPVPAEPVTYDGLSADLSACSRDLLDEMDAVIAEVAPDPNAPVETRLAAVFDWMVKKLKYQYITVDLSQGYTEKLISELAEHTVFELRGSCEHQAALFCLFARRLGCEAMVAEGDFLSDNGTEWIEHAWVILRVGDTFRHCDVLYGRNHTGGYSRTMFLTTDEKIAATHRWERSRFPVCG